MPLTVFGKASRASANAGDQQSHRQSRASQIKWRTEMKRLSIRILAIAVLTPMAAFGAIGSASAAPHSPAAVHRAPAADKTAARTDDICAENPFCNKRSINP